MGDKKSSVLYVLDILKEYTDKDHSLTYNEIASKLNNIYGIEVERRTVARDIDILIDKHYDVVKRGNNGVSLLSRDFEEGELLYLIDAIYSSRSIPARYTHDLVKKLTKDISKYERIKLNHLEKIDNDVRTDNKQLFFNIEMLNEAIEKGKKVEFQYGVYGIDKIMKPKKDGKVYKVSPYFLTNNHGKYYLVCNNDKYENIGNYKIDNILNIKILNEDIKEVKSLPGQQDFTIKKYLSEHVYMMAGKSVTVKMKILEEERVNDVVDWFGNKIFLSKDKDGHTFVILNINEDALIFWALQYGKSVEVVEPKETRKKIKNLLEEMLQRYDK